MPYLTISLFRLHIFTCTVLRRQTLSQSWWSILFSLPSKSLLMVFSLMPSTAWVLVRTPQWSKSLSSTLVTAFFISTCTTGKWRAQLFPTSS